MAKERADKEITELQDSVTSADGQSAADDQAKQPASEMKAGQVVVTDEQPADDHPDDSKQDNELPGQTPLPANGSPEPADVVDADAPAEEADKAGSPDPAQDSTEVELPSEDPQEEVADSADEALQPEEKEEINDDSRQDDTAASSDAEKIADLEAAHQIDDHHDEWEGVDFDNYSKEELVEAVRKLAKEEDPLEAFKVFKRLEPVFEKIAREERQQALARFLAEGGEEDDFDYKPDELTQRYTANARLIRDRRAQKLREQEQARKENLQKAEQLLEELRQFVDSEESSSSFNRFKEFQQRWKEIGDVPPQHSRTLWASYNALIHRFYDQRSIYFELKELDRKKNYEAKLALCEKAEALAQVKDIREAVKQLNELHYEYKHIGPVPRELQEELWQRFKAASDKVYERRKQFVQQLKSELQANLEKKQALVARVEEYANFTSDRIKDWNSKTKELLEIQKEWEAIGGLPKDKAKEINKAFWKGFKKFFSNKHKFFKGLEAEREANLEKKQALVEQARELKDSEDWDATAEKLKALQVEWRAIGPVPEKMSKKIYEEFKEACDYFFERRRANVKSSRESYKANYKRKKEIIATIKELVAAADDNLEQFKSLMEEFLQTGFVPRKYIQEVKQGFQEAVAAYLEAVTTLNDREKAELLLKAEFSSLDGSEHSERELYQKEQFLRRQINKLEDNIALWQNNMEYFARSSSADKLRAEFEQKIGKANSQLEGLKRQLKLIRSL